MDLVIATGNAGKAKEFRQILSAPDAPIQFNWFDPVESDVPIVEETGRSFLENACLKASSYAIHTGRWALADDSGLQVAALDNRPGIHSARWAAMHDAGAGDAANNRLLLDQLTASEATDRSARFVCVLALADPKGRTIVSAAGWVVGTIIEEPRGAGGFGYDPLFRIEHLGKTTAELTPDQKHAISHRGMAIRRMSGVLRRCDLTFESA